VVAWTVPFALPLLVIHGVLNSQYPVTGWWLDAIPIRRTGLTFGAEMSLRVVVLSIVAGFWLSVDRDALVESLLRLRLPTSLIMLPVQGVVMSRLIQIRIEKILLAQQARGTPVSGSFIQRLLSLPSLLVPVVVGTFVEAEARVSVLLAHGYGRLEPARRSSGMELRTVVVTVAALLCLGVALLADRTW
jgi:energy-coupling factor transport system permease protein